MKRQTPIRRLLKASEAREFLGLSRFTFEKLIHDGRLPIVQLEPGGKWQVDLRDLEQFIEANKTTSPL